MCNCRIDIILILNNFENVDLICSNLNFCAGCDNNAIQSETVTINNRERYASYECLTIIFQVLSRSIV